MPRTDLALALLLATLTGASRVPFRARLLPTWDAVQFALALHDYDIVRHQPHPPGYILYVGLGRLLETVTGEPTASLTWLAVAASVVAVFVVYRLAWELWGRATAVVAASLLATSPLFWFYGLVGLSYTTEAALATAVALAIWRMRGGDRWAIVRAAAALGLAGGVRQSILVLLFPAWLGVAWAGRRERRALGGGLAALGLATAAWLVPMVWLTGGPARYAGAAVDLFQSTVRATTVLGDWRGNVVALGEGLVLGLGLLLPVTAAVLAAGIPRLLRGDPRAWFLAGWVGPPVLVYTFVHFGQYGYLLAVLPALCLVLARGLVRAVAPLPAWGPGRLALATLLAAVLAAHAAFVLGAGPGDVPGRLAATPDAEGWTGVVRAHYRFRLWPHTVPGLRDGEAVIRTVVAGVRGAFDPADTVLVTELGNPRSYPWFRHVMYYLPEYAVYHLRVGAYSPGWLSSRQDGTLVSLGGAEVLLPASTRRVAWVVDYWSPLTPRPPGLRAYPLAHGRWLYALDIERRPVEHAGYRLTPVTALARLH